MSDLMLQGILRMPPDLWDGSVLDIKQRHEAYLEAAQRLDDFENEEWARAILADSIQDDNSLALTEDHYIWWPGQILDHLVLDGSFRPDMLRAVAWWIENMKVID